MPSRAFTLSKTRLQSNKLTRTLRSNFSAQPDVRSAAVLGNKLIAVGGSLYDSTVGSDSIGEAVAVVNVGRPAAAVYAPSSGGAAVVSVSGGGGGGSGATSFSQLAGTISDGQAPQFLKTDGSRALLGNLSATDGVTIDGVDISAHAANPNAHHNWQHSMLSSADHVYSGGNAMDLFGLAGPSTLGIHTPSNDPGASSKILKSSSSGNLSLESLTTPLINTASGNLTVSPAGSFVKLGSTKGIESAGIFSSGFTGSGLRIDDGITKAGKVSIEADNLTIRGTMRVYELLIQQIRMTNGSLLVTSTGKVKAVSGSGPYTITTDGKHGFAVNDLILAQRWDPTEGALTGSYIYRSGMQVTSITTTGTDWQFTADLIEDDPPVEGAEYGRIGNTTDTDRQGGLYLTSDDSYAPYMDIFNGVDSFTAWSGPDKLKTRIGKLDGIGDSALNPSDYGVYTNNSFLRGDFLTGNGAIRMYQASGINIAEDVWGSWDNKRALQWWPDVSTMSGDPSLAIYTGKAVGGFTDDQNFAYIDSNPTGGQALVWSTSLEDIQIDRAGGF